MDFSRNLQRLTSPLFPVQTEGIENRPVTDGKKDGLFTRGLIGVLMPCPIRQNQKVSLLPIESLPIDQAVPSSPHHKIDNTRSVTMGAGVDARP